MKDEALKLALYGITKVPTLTHGVLVKLSDVEAAITVALAQPAQRKPLTVEEIWSAIRPLTRSDEVCKALVHVSMDEYRAIEAAHGIGAKP
jgi:hypothetical protein